MCVCGIHWPVLCGVFSAGFGVGELSSSTSVAEGSRIELSREYRETVILASDEDGCNLTAEPLQARAIEPGTWAVLK